MYCNNCTRKTYHVKIKTHEVRGQDEEGMIDWSNEYSIVQCQGCKEIHFRDRHYFSEDQHWEPEAPIVYRDSYYPPREFRKKPSWFDEISTNLAAVLEEVYVALQNGLGFLSAVGARTALETVLNEKLNDIGGFGQKLKALADNGLITPDEMGLLESVTEAGNAAAHRGYKPRPDDLIVVMDVLESIIEKLYLSQQKAKALKERAERLRKRIPPRPVKPS